MSACDGRAFFTALYQQNQSIAAWGFVLYSSKRLIAAWGLSYKPDLGKIVAYQIYIKSFCDSDGDGIGDLPGITSKLDYLASLEIDYVWITPFFPSPQRDNGYDVSDYCAVDPSGLRNDGRFRRACERGPSARPRHHARHGVLPYLRGTCLVPAGACRR